LTSLNLGGEIKYISCLNKNVGLKPDFEIALNPRPKDRGNLIFLFKVDKNQMIVNGFPRNEYFLFF